MPGDEDRKAHERAVKQAEERGKRYEARNQVKVTSTIDNPDLHIATPSYPNLVSTTSHTDFESVTLSNPTLERSTLSAIMEAHQYKTIIDSIPTFSDETKKTINDWLDVISLKFDLLNYDLVQRRRFIPQYWDGAALKWHLLHRNDLPNWNEYITVLAAAFPQVITTSRDMNLQMLRDRRQDDAESFTEYYTSVLELCRQHNPDMADPQVIDWLKVGMRLNLYERLQGEEYLTPRSLLVRAQRLELDAAVLEARKREYATSAIVTANSPSPVPIRNNRQDHRTYYQPNSTPLSIPSYPPPLMSTLSPYDTSHLTSTPQSSSYSSSFSPRRPISCYTCGQAGHISPQCPSRPNY